MQMKIFFSKFFPTLFTLERGFHFTNFKNVSLIKNPQSFQEALNEAIKTFRAEILTIYLLVLGQNDDTKKDISKLIDL